MKRFEIIIWGEDSTRFEIELTGEQEIVLKKICELSEETSIDGCMPTMEYREVKK